MIFVIFFKYFHFADNVVKPLHKGTKLKALFLFVPVIIMVVDVILWYENVGRKHDKYYHKNGGLQGINYDAMVL